MKMDSTQSLLMKGALWIGISRIAVNLIGFVSTIILARLLLPEDFGLVAIASAVATIFSSVTELSLSQAIIQHDEPGEDHFHTAWTLNLLRGLLLATVVALLGYPTALFYDDPRLYEILLGLGATMLVGSLINPKLAIFERRLQFSQWMTLSLAEKLTGFFVAIIIAYQYESYWALVGGVMASQIAKVIASYLLIHYQPKFSLSEHRDLLSFSIWLTLGQAVQAFNWRANPLILGAFLPTAALGHYGVGSRLSSMAVTEALQPVTQVLFPAFSRLKSEADRLRAAYLRAQGLLCLLSFPIGFGLAGLAAPIVLLLLGESWREAIPVIQFLAIAAVIQRQVQLNQVAMATGNTKSLFRRDLRALVIRLPLLFGGIYLGPHIGIGMLNGALAGHALSSLVNAILNMQLVSQITRVTMKDQLRILWRPGLAAIGMAALLPYAYSLWPQTGDIFTLAALLMGTVALGAAAYVVLVASLWLISGLPNSAECEAIGWAKMALSGRMGNAHDDFNT